MKFTQKRMRKISSTRLLKGRFQPPTALSAEKDFI
jgi:hypothetical protein